MAKPAKRKTAKKTPQAPRGVVKQMDMPKGEICDLPLKALIPFPGNARSHPPKQIEALKKALTTFGQVENLVVQDSTGYVLGGNGRLTAMRELGWKTVRVYVIDVNDKQALALNIALNKLAEMSEWDDELYDKSLEQLINYEVDPAIFGFDAKELEKQIKVSGHTRTVGGAEDATQDAAALKYSVIADFENEDDQGELLAELEKRGITCRILIS